MYEDIWIIGLGVTGLSCAKFLFQFNLAFGVWDTRLNPPNKKEFLTLFPNVQLKLGALDANILKHAKQLVVSPGLNLNNVAIQTAIEHGVQIISDIEFFSQYNHKRIFAITGSNGKTTVTNWVADMAQRAGMDLGVGGNIGKPVLDLYLEHDYSQFLFELSSFQLDLIHFLDLQAAVLLNISEDHLDRYNSFDDYCRSKLSIFKHAKLNIYNRDDPNIVVNKKSNYYSFGMTPSTNKNDVYYKAPWIYVENYPFFNCQYLSVLGVHNIYNAMAAIMLARSMSVHNQAITDSLQYFTGVAHRCQKIAVKKGVTFINDSKATNTAATLSAMQYFPADKLWMIVGGDSKGVDLSELARDITKVKGVVYLGKDGEKIAYLHDNKYAVMSIEESVELLSHVAVAGDIVLLSPACSSLDMFLNYEQRGDMFVNAVNRLVGDNID